MNELEEKLRRVLPKPGVYLLKDAAGKILYVGKAKQLRNRLRSHFHPGGHEDAKHRRLMEKVADFETILTDSEVEALIMEANFVKAHRPRYNINLKDDKSYPYIRVSHEPFPRVFLTRTIVKDGSLYFGPYTEAMVVRQLVQAIHKIFPLRTCSRKIGEGDRERYRRPCLNYHIGRCHAPCQGFISKEDYTHMVDEVVALIKGKGTALIEDLEKRMAEASRMKKFEEAAELRDQLRAVKTFSRRQKVVSSDFEDRDIFAIALEDTLACGLVFLLREGKIINRNHFILAGGEEESEENFLAAFLKQYYLKTDFIPAEIYLPRELPEKTELEAWLSRRRGKNVRLIVPRIGPKAGLMDMCAENAAHLLREYLAQKQAASERISGMVAALRKDLALTTDPRRIKAFDISHTQGTETVASLVVFENGRPRKSDYRKYIIRSAAAGDDYAAMKEAVGRHFRRLLDEGGRRPDLVLIDGGKGQLSAALEALHSLGIKDQAIAGLAKKKEEVFLEGDTESRNIPKDSAGLHLLQRVRDEAHRFAVTFHRNRRGKGQLRSRLDDIPGVGPKRRKALLAAFGSLQGISKASQEEIEAVPGMNRKIAAAILQALRK